MEWLFTKKAVIITYLALLTTLFGLFVLWRHDANVTKQLKLATEHPNTVEVVKIVKGPVVIKERIVIVTSSSTTTIDRETQSGEVILDSSADMVIDTPGKEAAQAAIANAAKKNIVMAGMSVDAKTVGVQYIRTVGSIAVSPVINYQTERKESTLMIFAGVKF